MMLNKGGYGNCPVRCELGQPRGWGEVAVCRVYVEGEWKAFDGWAVGREGREEGR